MGLHNKNFFIFGRMFITMYIYMIIRVFVCVLSTRVYGRAHICVRMCVIFFFEVPFTILIFFSPLARVCCLYISLHQLVWFVSSERGPSKKYEQL